MMLQNHAATEAGVTESFFMVSSPVIDGLERPVSPLSIWYHRLEGKSRLIFLERQPMEVFFEGGGGV
jgi:hypothetical protein